MNPNAAVWRHTSLIFAAVLVLYLLTPTKNFYWDGITFAFDIERDPGGPWFFHPNHLLYNALGRSLWLVANAAGLEVRALTVLRLISTVTGAAAVALLFRVLRGIGSSSYVATCVALTFAVSATWWKFATDANSYIPTTFLLLVCFWLLVREVRPSVIVIGFVHAAAILLHQLAVFFYPAALLALWLGDREKSRRQRLSSVGLYTLAIGVPVLAVYITVFALRIEGRDVAGLLGWVTSYAPDASFSFGLLNNVQTSLAGHVRLLFGGSMRLMLVQRSPVSAVAAVALVVTAVILAGRLVRNPPRFSASPSGLRRFYPSLLLWFGAYALFLLFWLPHNTFYRLLYLPSLFLMAAGFLEGQKTKHNRLVLAVAAVLLFNFGFHIHPQSQPGANRSLQVAEEMRIIWKPGDTVFADVHASENRTIRYFSPEVQWRDLWERVWISQVEESFQKTDRVWFDSVALKRFLDSDPELAAWIRQHCRVEESYEFPGTGRTIAFVRLAKLGTGRNQ